MATRTAAVAGGAWNVAGTWVEGAVPTAADDVVLAVTSGNVSIPSGYDALCRSIDCTGYIGTLSFANSTGELYVGDASGGALKFVAGMTLSGTGGIILRSTSDNGAAGWNVDFAGKTLGNLSFNGVGGRWNLVGNFTLTSGADLTLTAGHLVFGTITATGAATTNDLQLSGTGVRRIDFGGVTFGGTWGKIVATTSTNLTVDANTATFPSGGNEVDLGTADWNGLSVTMTATGDGALRGSGTLENLTFAPGIAGPWDLFVYGNTTIEDTFTMTAGGGENQHLRLQSDTVGTARTLTVNGTVTFTNVDVRDIAAAGTASWDLSGVRAGNAGGNSGITFPAPLTLYQSGGSNGSFTLAGFSLTSGGASGQRAPLIHDSVILDGNSLATATSYPEWLPGIDASAYTGDLDLNTHLVHGSLIFGAGMAVGSSIGALTLAGRGTHTLNLQAEQPSSVTVNAPGGSWTLAAALTTTGAFTSLAGAFDAAGLAVSAGSLVLNDANGVAHTVDFDGSIVTLTDTSGTLVNAVTTAALTFSHVGGELRNAASTTNNRAMNMGSLTWGTLRRDGDDDTGDLTIGGNPTLEGLILGGATETRLTAGNTVTVTGTVTIAGEHKDFVSYGVTVGNVQTPDHADLDATTAVELVALIAPADWTPSSEQPLVSKYGDNTATGHSYALTLRSTGALGFRHSNGTTARLASSTALLNGMAAYEKRWVKATRDSATGVVQFWTAAYVEGSNVEPTGGDWTQLGTDVTSGAGENIRAGTDPLEVGNFNEGSNTTGFTAYIGRIYRAIVRNAIGGAAVADFNAAGFDPEDGTYTDSTGKVWTPNAAALVGAGQAKLRSTSTSTKANLNKGAGSVGLDRAVLNDITFGGGATWIAYRSTDGGDNSGITFDPGPPPGGTLDKAKLGTALLDAVKHGSSVVDKMYVGADQVWP